MFSNLKRTVISAAVTSALLAGSGAYAFDAITVDRDGTGGASAAFNIDNLGWAPNTVLLQKAFTVVDDGVSQLTAPTTNFNLWTQGVVSGFNLQGGKGSISNEAGVREWTFQMGLTQLFDEIITGNTTSYSSGIAAAPTVNFFKIFYDGTAATQSNVLAGSGFGDDGAAGLIATGTGGTCDPAAAANVAAGKLILCGAMLTGGVSASIRTTASGSDSAEVIVPLDGFGGDNYPGLATNRSPNSGGGSLILNVDVFYQDFDFILSNVSTVNVGIDLNHNANLQLAYAQTDPSALVVGQSWSVGTDKFSSTAFGGTRDTNNFSCNDDNFTGTNDADCSFVAQTTGTTSFNGTTAPEPGSLALMGLGLAAFGMLARRRRKAV